MLYSKVTMETVEPRIREILKEGRYEIEKSGSDDKAVRLKKGLFLYGVTGSGKTHTLYAVNHALQREPVSKVENWVELLTELKDRMFQHQSIKYVVEAITEKQFIFIDDVGAENQTDWVQEFLYLIIDRCYRYEKTLFISTNLSMVEFSQKYGDRLLSRICEMCVPHEMEEVDHRLEK